MTNKIKWWMMLSGASLAAMTAAAPALAQDVSDEIVVTATGRSAAIQDVPLAVTALGAEALENAGVDNLMDVEQVAPSFRIYAGQSTTAGTIARIRGLGTGADNPGFESAVGIFIDGVYRSRSGVAMSDLPELERIEVLRGPQGTLFGRNTSAGAISIVTAGPEYDTHAWMEGTAGNLGMAAARVGITGAVIEDKLAVRLDGSIRGRDGYINDIISGDDINDQNRWQLRGQALWDISPDASLRVIVDGTHTDEQCCAVTPLVYGGAQIIVESIAGPGATVPGEVIAPGAPSINAGRALFGGNLVGSIEERNMTVTPGRRYGESVDEWGISGQLDWDIGEMHLTSITAYRDWDATRDQDIDFSLFDLAYRDGLELGFETLTQEFRLQGESGRIDWLVGLFLGNEKLDTTDRIRLGDDANAYINGLAQLRTGALTTTTTAVPGFSTPATGPFEVFDSTAGDDDNPQIWGQEGLLFGQTPGTLQGVPLPQDPVESLFYFAALGGFHPFPTIPAVANTNTGLQNAYLTPAASGQGQQADRWEIDTNSLALFTHNEISLTDQLIWTIGLRFNHETKDLNADLLANNNTCLSIQGLELATGAAVPGPGGIITAMLPSAAGALLSLACNPAINPVANGNWEGDSEENEWSGTTSLAYHVNDDVMVYAGYSRGYKSGGYNVDRSAFSITPALTDKSTLSTDQLHFEPEFVDSYEAGIKTTLFGGTTDFNVNIFLEQLHDYQNNSFNGTNFVTRNVPETVSRGVEVDFLSRPTDRLTLQGGLLYNEAFYDSTVAFSSAAGNTIFAGDPLDHAPEWSLTGAVTYEQPLAEDLVATFYVDGRWNSDYRNQTLSRDPLGRTDQEAFALFNGRASLGDQDGNWGVELWVRNIADEFYTVGAFEATFQPGTYLIYPGEPRTYGVTLRARY